MAGMNWDIDLGGVMFFSWFFGLSFFLVGAVPPRGAAVIGL
jgi:hypothetical protein